MQKVNLAASFRRFHEAWVPRVVGDLNGQQVKLAYFEGEYLWHQHAEEDEMFLVVEGSVEIHLRDQVISLQEGEFLVVPRKVEHKPVARERAKVLLFEPATTRSTGSATSPLTLEPSDLEHL